MHIMEKLFSIFDGLKENYEAELLSSNHNKIKDLQLRALEQYGNLPVPSSRLKTWSQLSKLDFDEVSMQLASEPKIVNIDKKDKNRKLSGSVLISEDTIEFWLEEEMQSKGVVLCDLYSAAEKHRDLLDKALKNNRSEFNKISAITAGLGRHGFFLYIPRKLRIDKPIEIVIRLEKEKTFLPASGFIVIDEQASALITLQHTSALSDNDHAVFSLNMLSSVGTASNLCFIEMQKSGKKVWNFVNEKLILAKEAKLERFLLDSGGMVTKRTFSVELNEEGSQAIVTGIYTPKASQVFVYDTQQKHLASNTNSDLQFKGVLDDSAYSMWKGNVYVAEGTRGTDGFQVNNNLLLNEAAHAESIPGLEIIADDVRCSHAVTLSSVDPEQIFFLRTRGIDAAEAEKLIVSGFIQAASLRIKDKNLLKMVEEELN